VVHQEAEMTDSDREGWEAAYIEHGDGSLWGDDPIPCIEQAVSAIRDRGYSAVLDIGCGDGRNVEYLVHQGFACVGADLSSSAVELAASRLHGRAVFVVENAMNLTVFPDASVYAMTCFDLFGQVSDPEKMMQTFRRVLNPEGLLIANIYSTGDSEYGRGDQVGQHSFRYNNTLFRFYEEAEVQQLFMDWLVLVLERSTWEDPPHGEYRPYRHQHESWLVIAAPAS
jgi:SAM-dependent methyltransferase